MSIPCVHSTGVRSRLWFARPFSMVVVLGMIAMAGGSPGRCLAGPEGLSGRVVDKAGAAVSGAEVWAVGGEWDHPRTVTHANADGSGRFVLPRPSKPRGARDVYSPTILARASDGRLGWAVMGWPIHPHQGELRIVVGPGAEVRGRVEDQGGRPIAGAEITPVVANRMAYHRPAQNYLQFPPELAGPLHATTAADGTFAIRSVPQGIELHANIAARGFGTPRVSWDTNKPVTIVLDGRLGRVEGTLRPPDAKGLSGKLALSIRRRMPFEDRSASPLRVMVFRTVTAGKDGAFRFGDLPPGTYDLNPDFPDDAAFSADAVAKIEVGPNAVARVEVPLERLIAITGRVVDARTGRGIAAARLRSGLLSSPNSLQFVAQAETGADGRYTIHARPGKVQIDLEAPPKGYLGLRSREILPLDARADRAWPDMKLAPAIELDGVVADAAGKPVAGADVLVLPAPVGVIFSDGRRVITGPDGSFHLDQLDPDDTLPVWARTKEATTDGVVVIRPGELKGKLALTIDPKFAFRIRGRVTDRAGKRLAGAQVVLSWYRSYVSGKLERPGMGIGSSFDVQTTDASGWFVFRGLWPGDRYRLDVAARGYGKAESPEIQGQAGETQDLGTIVLAEAGGHLAGRVIGSDGKPVAGASVFNRGDAPTAVTTRTDAAGRFRLEGLLPGTRYAFVHKQGYRFTGAKVDGDADDLTITLLRTDEPPPAWKPGASPTLADQRAFARDVLVRVWETFGEEAEQNGASDCIPAMARIDLDLAMQWSAERGHRHDARARAAAAEELAETDGPGALELLALVDAIDKPYILQELAERFAGSDPAKALLFANEAAVQGRALPQPRRSAALAEAGAMLVRLVRVEAGRKLIDEAAADATRMGVAGMEGLARGTAARALAPFNPKRALALIEPFRDPNDRDRYTGFVASALAATDPDRALALADAVSQALTLPETIRTEVASRIGAEHPDRAVRIIERIKGVGGDKMQAEALGWLAVAVAPRDRARAAALIDRALALPVDRHEAFRSWIHFGGAMAPAAQVAACARHAGYPDMGGVILRVMAARTSPGDRDGSGPALEIRSATMAAVPLALVAPGAARVLLQQIEARSGLDPAKLADVAGPDWLRAWGLVDLQKARALVDARLAIIEKAKGAGFRSSGIFPMVETLISPPARREAKVFHVEGPTWRPVFQY